MQVYDLVALARCELPIFAACLDDGGAALTLEGRLYYVVALREKRAADIR
jgi:hypothetical protein